MCISWFVSRLSVLQSKLGVCYLQHRIRTGTNCHTVIPLSTSNYSLCTMLSGGWSQFLMPSIIAVCGIYYMYIILFILAMVVDLSLPYNNLKIYPSSRGFTLLDLSLLSTIHIKVAYLVLIMRPILRFLQEGPSRSMRRFMGKNSSKCKAIILRLVLAVAVINFLLIAIVNPSLLNPGPDHIKVSYQNVRGLIPFSHLKQSQPNLDHTKIFEINTHLSVHNPDVMLLSETWLKKSVKDTEIKSNKKYNVYRSDRSQLTHPSDPDNPSKFRRNGGGVLIAARSDINATIKRISMRRGAEIVAIEICIKEVKYIFCVIYRVGTLGLKNHKSIVDSIQPLFSGRKAKKIFILGDFNLCNVIWPYGENVQENISPIEQSFLESFNNFGLQQCITVPTHLKGRTLDLLLTNCPGIVEAINVDKNVSICNSDHFPVEFKVKVNVQHKKAPKRKIFNFKRANWDAMNHDLRGVNWDTLVGSTEPEFAWRILKNKIVAFANRHIPTITIKNNSQPPWFDSEVHHAYLKKERAHANKNSSEINGLKFSKARKDFKNIAATKMRDNLYNSDDPQLITKKFWSHVKSNSKSHS